MIIKLLPNQFFFYRNMLPDTFVKNFKNVLSKEGDLVIYSIHFFP